MGFGGLEVGLGVDWWGGRGREKERLEMVSVSYIPSQVHTDGKLQMIPTTSITKMRWRTKMTMRRAMALLRWQMLLAPDAKTRLLKLVRAF